MKTSLISLWLIGSVWAMPVQQAMDPDYKLFQLSATGTVLSDESKILVYESPFGQIFNGGSWRHEEVLLLDLRRIQIDFCGLTNVPLAFGMSYKTFPRDPYSSSFQINRVSTSIISPKWEGFVLEFQVDALSNSGRQGATSYWKLYYQNNFGLLDNPLINLLSFQFSTVSTNGLGWIGLSPSGQGQNLDGLTWGDLFNRGWMWSPNKGYLANVTLDGKPLHLDGYISGRFEYFTNTDPTQPQQNGMSYTRYGLYYGNSFWIGRDLKLSGEVGVDRLQDIWVLKSGLQIFLATNFN